MSELREECYKCLNNQKCLGGAEYGSLYCMMNRKLKMQSEDDSVYAHKFAIMQKQIDEKDKRIKELEEENKIFVQNGSNVKLEIYIKNNYIPKQKVKDKIKDLEYNSDLGFEKSLEEIFKIEVLEKLLEEK